MILNLAQRPAAGGAAAVRSLLYPFGVILGGNKTKIGPNLLHRLEGPGRMGKWTETFFTTKDTKGEGTVSVQPGHKERKGNPNPHRAPAR